MQFGTVWKSSRATLDVDVYHIGFQNTWSSTTDATTGDTLYFQGADSTTKGIEAESTVLLGGGLAVYLNATAGKASYNDTGLWVQNTPSNTETVGLTYNKSSWNLGLFSKWIGQMYNDNGAVHQAVPIDPFSIVNTFVNYQFNGSSPLRNSRLRFTVNNLTNSHAITAVTPASATSNLPAAGDILTLMGGRSVSVSLTVGVSPR